MRRSLALFCFVSLVPAVLFAAAPKAVPVEPIVDFEIVPRGEVIVHTFEIRNAGDSTLELSDVRPACGCTVVEFDRSIAPGATGKLAARVDTSDFYGPISKSISVYTNDIENPQVMLVVKAEVKPFIGVVPGHARFNYVQGEDLQPVEQLLWAEDGRDFKIVEIKDPYEYVDVKISPAAAERRNPEFEGSQWMVDVHLAPNAPVGSLAEYIELTTDHPKQKTVKLPLSGFVRPRSHVTPHELDFGKLDGGSLPLRRTLHMTNFAMGEIQVESIDTGFPALGVIAEPSSKQPGHRFLLRLTIGPEMPKGDFSTVLKIKTSDPRKPVIEVPVRGEIL